MNTESHHLTINGLPVRIVRKAIKNLHLGVYPPHGRVRVAAPLAVTDEAVRLAVIGGKPLSSSPLQTPQPRPPRLLRPIDN
jgi:hypothetical protein